MTQPVRLPLLGTILALAFIQFVLRKCFALGNVLLQKQLPPEWISSVLLSSDLRLTLYFRGLVAGLLLTAGIFWYLLQAVLEPGSVYRDAMAKTIYTKSTV